jgi:hypothetical protein
MGSVATCYLVGIRWEAGRKNYRKKREISPFIRSTALLHGEKQRFEVDRLRVTLADGRERLRLGFSGYDNNCLRCDSHTPLCWSPQPKSRFR